MNYVIGGHTICLNDRYLTKNTNPLTNFIPFLEKGDMGVKPLFAVHFWEKPDEQKDEATADNINSCHFYAGEDLSCVLSHKSKEYRLKIQAGVNKTLLELTVENKLENAVCSITMNESVSDSLLSFLLMLVYGIAASRYDTLLLHASAIIVNGKGLLFLGESGTGKSTHAALWTKAFPESCLLNDDNPVVRIMDGIPLVYGSPWSGKTDCYKNEEVEIAAIIRLQQGNKNRIERLHGVDSLCALLPSCPSLFLYDDELASRTCMSLSGLLRHTPVYRLECLPDRSAPELVYNTLQKDLIF